MTAEGPALDIDRVVEALDRHDVDYLLVGGVSAMAYGATRQTEDFDCLPERSIANLDRLAAVLRELRAFLRVGGLSDEEARALPVVIDAHFLSNMGISTWRTDAGDFDVLADMPASDGQRLGYEVLAQRCATAEVAGHQVLVAALDDVIASKEWANRAKDHEALPELYHLNALRKGGDAHPTANLDPP